MDPRAGLDGVENRKFLTLPGLELDPSVIQPAVCRYTDTTTPAPYIFMVWYLSRGRDNNSKGYENFYF
jgi:hypothetical protein